MLTIQFYANVVRGTVNPSMFIWTYCLVICAQDCNLHSTCYSDPTKTHACRFYCMKLAESEEGASILQV